MTSKNHYRVLGICRDATDEEIRKAYYALIRGKHPDQIGVNQEFTDLTEAYTTLRDNKETYLLRVRIEGEICMFCGGLGKVRHQKGFTSVEMLPCTNCYGLGYLLPEGA